MVLFFLGAILILFRPGAKKLHADAASIPLRDDTLERKPATSSKDNSLKSEDAT
jgi:cytochrome c oxidase cbb3-type subunit 4